MISKGSLKLRIMSELTEKHMDKPASLYWKETAYKQHEKEMLSMLIKACKIDTVILSTDSQIAVSTDTDEDFSNKNGTNLEGTSCVGLHK